MAGLDILDGHHGQTVRQALANILATGLAQFTYAQILDGLPTEQCLLDSCKFIRDHPVSQMGHTAICEGYLDKAREFRSCFDPLTLCFSRSALDSFQKASRGSKEFNLRLIELVVVACHQIGAYLFELDDGAHKHEIHNAWQSRALEEGTKTYRPYYPPPAAFFHQFYMVHEQYPRGVADVAGYWAEGRIFGGVVVFDRGESEQECKDIWIHGILSTGPRTLYPPTPEQLDALVAFLLGNSIECPLPIHGTRENRPRWDPYDSMRFHIFRDRYERRIPPRRPPARITHTFTNWPELEDNWTLVTLMNKETPKELGDDEKWKAACEGLKRVTKSSPKWPPRQWGPYERLEKKDSGAA